MSDRAHGTQGPEGVTVRRLAQAVDALAAVQTELDQERLQRHQSEALLDRIFGSLSDAVLVVDPHGQVTRANRAAAELFGRAPEELLGLSAAELYRDDVPRTPWELLKAAPEGHLSHETAALSPDGGEREVSLSCAIVRDADGRVHGAIHAARDLSEVHRLLREVATAEARWRLLAHLGSGLADSLYPADVLDTVVRELEQDTGFAVAVVLSDEGVVSRVFASSGAPGSPAPLDALTGMVPPRGSALASAVVEGRDVHAPTVSGGFPLFGPPADAVRSAAVLALRGEAGTVGALAVLARQPGTVDETTYALMEEVAARLALSITNARLRERLVEHRAAQEAARYRDEILAAISHEMKTPLAVLLGHQHLLEDSDAQPDAIGLDEIHASMGRQVRRLRRLMVQFLDYVRTEAGHELSVSLTPLDVAELVASVATSVSGSGRIGVDLDDTLPPVLADDSRLELALSNLLSNALKYSPADSEVTITGREVGRHVEITVADRGPGISPSEQGRLFEKFARGAGDTGVEGTGLGLYMTRQVMRAQGGDVRVASRPGEGSRFTLVLRRAEEEGQ